MESLNLKSRDVKVVFEDLGERHTYREWAKKLNMSESTFQRWISVLLIESKINQAIYGNSKVVWIE